jgi:hypothetical protein
MKTLFELQAETAQELLAQRIELYPELKKKFFVVILKDRHNGDVFKVRKVNFAGLKETAKWIRDEASRDENYWNVSDNPSAPSKAKSGISHYQRGLTSHIPVGALVDVLVEVHDTADQASDTKNHFTSLEKKYVRRPVPTPEMVKAVSTGIFDIDRLMAETVRLKGYQSLHLQSQ